MTLHDFCNRLGFLMNGEWSAPILSQLISRENERYISARYGKNNISSTLVWYFTTVNMMEKEKIHYTMHLQKSCFKTFEEKLLHEKVKIIKLY